MANTPRETTSYIILGVKKRVGGPPELWGLDRYLDGADLQTQFKDRVYPIPDVSYSVLQHDGKESLATLPFYKSDLLGLRVLHPVTRFEFYLLHCASLSICVSADIHCLILSLDSFFVAV